MDYWGVGFRTIVEKPKCTQGVRQPGKDEGGRTDGSPRKALKTKFIWTKITYLQRLANRVPQNIDCVIN